MKCKNHTDVEIDEIYESIEEKIYTTMEKGKFIGHKPITYKDKYLELYDMMVQLLYGVMGIMEVILLVKIYLM